MGNVITNRNASRLEFERLLVRDIRIIISCYNNVGFRADNWPLVVAGHGEIVHETSQSAPQHAATGPALVRLLLVQVNDLCVAH